MIFTIKILNCQASRAANVRLGEQVMVFGFPLSGTEVTQGQWKAVMGSNPSYFGSCGDEGPVKIED